MICFARRYWQSFFNIILPILYTISLLLLISAGGESNNDKLYYDSINGKPINFFYPVKSEGKIVDRLAKEQLKGHKIYSYKELVALDKKILSGKIPRLARIIIEEKNVVKISYSRDKLKPRLNLVINKLSRLAQKGLLKNTTFLLYYDDGVTEHTTIQKEIGELPIFVFSVNDKIANREQFILFPDDYTIGQGIKPYWIGWSEIMNEIKDAKNEYPWELKIQKVFWRGRPTDCYQAENFCPTSPRIKLVELAKKNPQIDAAYSAEKAELTTYELKRWKWEPFMSRAQQLKYKYLISLDGIAATYPGLLWKLYSNSVVIKQDSDDVQWFYSLLKPWQHYVPVKYDLNNLLEIINWLKAHDQHAKEISEQAQKLVEDYFKPENIDQYIVYLLNLWSEKVLEQQ